VIHNAVHCLCQEGARPTPRGAHGSIIVGEQEESLVTRACRRVRPQTLWVQYYSVLVLVQPEEKELAHHQQAKRILFRETEKNLRLQSEKIALDHLFFSHCLSPGQWGQTVSWDLGKLGVQGFRLVTEEDFVNLGPM
jgi:hypothetical protein